MYKKNIIERPRNFTFAKTYAANIDIRIVADEVVNEIIMEFVKAYKYDGSHTKKSIYDEIPSVNDKNIDIIIGAMKIQADIIIIIEITIFEIFIIFHHSTFFP